MYKLVPTPLFVKQLKKLDSYTEKRVKKYLENVVVSPKSKGKMLIGNRKNQWRYRVGDYRIIVQIKDDELIILALEVGHRKDIYC